MILPYVEAIKDRDDLPLGQHSLYICDVFAAHRDNAFRDFLKSKNVSVLFVPGNRTGELQPLDARPSINQLFKDTLKAEFTNWYSHKIRQQLKKGHDIEDVEIDLRLTALINIKPG